MENLLWLIPLLACPIGMFVMMLLMGKGMGMMGKDKDRGDEAKSTVTELRAEKERLEAEIQRREGAEREPGASSTPRHA